MSLRTDERSWLIYDDESLGAFARVLEMYSLSVTGQKLARHPDQRIRAIGTLMVRIGETRGVEMIRNDGAQRVAVEHMVLFGAFLAGLPHDESKLDEALNELHSLAFRLDSRANSAGIAGPGVHRLAVRGD